MKDTAAWRCFSLVLLWVALHGAHEARIAVFVGGPSRHHTPKVQLAIANCPQNHFDLAALENRNDAPVPNRLAAPLALLPKLNVELFEALLELLKCVCVRDKSDRSRQELEAHDLRGTLAFPSPCLESDVVEPLGRKGHLFIQRGADYGLGTGI